MAAIKQVESNWYPKRQVLILKLLLDRIGGLLFPPSEHDPASGTPPVSYLGAF